MSKNDKPKGERRARFREFVARSKRRWHLLSEFLEGKNTLAGRVFAMASKTPIWITGIALILNATLFFTAPGAWFVFSGLIFFIWLVSTALLGGLTLLNLPRLIREAQGRFVAEEQAFARELRLFNEERVKRGLPEWDGRGPLLDNVSMSDLSSGGFVSAGSKAQAVKLEPLALPVRRYDLSDYSGKLYAKFGDTRVRIL